MPSSSYKVNDPVTTVAHKSSRPEEAYHPNGSSSKDREHNGSATSQSKPSEVPEVERWRLNYVPTPYDFGKIPAPDYPDSHTVEAGGRKAKRLEKDDRGHWDSKVEFLLSCIGLSVGLGNVWRFPYLAFENGGAAFLIPYIILLILIGKPMYFMETALGQYSQLGPLNVWKCAPVMKGVGVAMVVLSLITGIYYNQLMAYTLYYFFATLAFIGYAVPWSECNSDWADESCYSTTGHLPCLLYNVTSPTDEINCTLKDVSSATQYWENAVLKLDKEGLKELGIIGEIQWDLSLCLLLSWIIVLLCLMKGVKSSGKVVYFTATFPYVILVALLIMGVTLPGASKGLRFLFIPKWDKILNAEVWRKAAEQMFFSLSVSWGGLIMFGSYNKFRNKVHIDAIAVAFLDFLTSLVASISIFSVLGAMAEEVGLDDVTKVVDKGTGLAFIAFPQAISRTLPIPHLWSVLFFFMLFTLGLDSEFALMETVLTAIYDTFTSTRHRKFTVTAIVCGACFLLGLPLCATKGQYIFDIIDSFGGGIGVLLLAVFELIALHWVYGVLRFSRDLKFMLNFSPSIFWKVCWAFIAPVTLSVLFIYTAVNWENPKYGDIQYPDWAVGVGWCLTAVSVGMVPLFFIIIFFKRLFTGRIRELFKPSPDWGPGCPEARQLLLESYSAAGLDEGKMGIDNPALDTR